MLALVRWLVPRQLLSSVGRLVTLRIAPQIATIQVIQRFNFKSAVAKLSFFFFLLGEFFV